MQSDPVCRWCSYDCGQIRQILSFPHCFPCPILFKELIKIFKGHDTKELFKELIKILKAVTQRNLTPPKWAIIWAWEGCCAMTLGHLYSNFIAWLLAMKNAYTYMYSRHVWTCVCTAQWQVLFQFLIFHFN